VTQLDVTNEDYGKERGVPGAVSSSAAVEIERAGLKIDLSELFAMLEAIHCPSWPGGVARSAGVVVQEVFLEQPPRLRGFGR